MCCPLALLRSLPPESTLAQATGVGESSEEDTRDEAFFLRHLPYEM